MEITMIDIGNMFSKCMITYGLNATGRDKYLSIVNFSIDNNISLDESYEIQFYIDFVLNFHSF